ncbi:hypothetical protein PSN45_003136 [Yamadazyma tenuis]|uniref:Vacuolar ATPase assembly protein VMA22 n=1 Tax=Candida tenuis (strain ATCC 10573 / BCRC 21748 / CBS 615 / JCM 9827 / NBRC 10315 / NRRL Y-1498 / VKM Y-70) TaxID=590646 RepID=G3AZA0_CANTC|nr:uncharacterized protein CANTEDRAFT_101201 [Yamadazyma tenuis ATCC 10573]EGV66046.1 hypothetical protein CANTEDRAFT_101201 [Yamadazyma tenuis ATCC 10573]WEJ95613.1 hypothetical protein PSN45_003136 [Yamadazyma tenuis]
MDPSNHKDILTEQLLHLVDQYESLANTSFRTNFIDGFLNLSRANFNGGGLRTYGVKDFDLRSYLACKNIKSGPNLELEDYLQRQESKKHDKEPEYTKKDQTTKQNQNTAVSSSVHRSKNESISHTEEFGNSLYKDPINQFGALVPYQLREAQASFNLALINSVELVNLQNKISSIISQIEQL